MHYMILAGGSGTRLFPLSRKKFPKQFLRLEENRSLLEATLERCSRGKILIVGGRDTAMLARKTAGKRGVVLEEPLSRNTAPAILFGLSRVPGGETVAVMPSDHHIADVAALDRALIKAEKIAREGYIVTIGITPRRAETGYGYIRTGRPLSEKAWAVERFVEKPDKNSAEKFMESGDYLWNSGMFVFTKETMMREAACSPELKGFIEDLERSGAEIAYGNVGSESIDYAVMEKTEKAAVVLGEFDWNDVGSWEAVKRMVPETGGNSIMSGNVTSLESGGNLVSAPGKDVLLLGVSGLEIIDTQDVLLVGDLGKAQQVRDVALELGRKNPGRLEAHTMETRPWGNFMTILEEKECKVKRIAVTGGERLSVQYHNRRSEDWIIVSGEGNMRLGEETFPVKGGDHVHIPAGTVHSVSAETDMVFIETQRGKYLEEDDIVRLEDKYGRQ